MIRARQHFAIELSIMHGCTVISQARTQQPYRSIDPPCHRLFQNKLKQRVHGERVGLKLNKRTPPQQRSNAFKTLTVCHCVQIG